MAKIVTQIGWFRQDDIENLQDLERLRLILEYMPDNDLIGHLNRERGNGRNDNPVDAMWNSILAGVLYQHSSIEELRRDLARNKDLRRICGFDDGQPVPSKDAYSRFLKLLIINRGYIHNMFNILVEALKEAIPDFGETIAIDSKAISSHANKENVNRKKDGRRDLDADRGYKTYRGIDKDGNAWEKVKSWFGYKIHLIVDAKYELPVDFMVTEASKSDIATGHKLVDDLAKKHPDILNEKNGRCHEMSADKGYDDGKLIKKLYDEFNVKPIIDIRNMWKDDETKQLTGKENIVYDYKGNTYCYDSHGTRRLMVNGGFDSSRNTQRKLCPAMAKGVPCGDCGSCPVGSGVRIGLDEDRRVFTPIDRTSYKWEKCYAKRTSVERVNSRVDCLYGFEKHFIRGQVKMDTRCSIALVVMLALAYARAKENRIEDMRRFTVA